MTEEWSLGFLAVECSFGGEQGKFKTGEVLFGGIFIHFKLIVNTLRLLDVSPGKV